jgi:hypothetical protein
MGFQLTTLVVIGIFWSNCCRVLFKEVYKMQRKIPRLGILQEGENGKASICDVDEKTQILSVISKFANTND